MKDFSRKNLILPLLGTVLLMALPHNGFAAHPPSTQTIPQVLASKPEFSTLASAISLAGIEGALSFPESGVIGDPTRFKKGFTLLAPTNDAFSALPPEVLTGLINNPEKLKKVLLNHVFSFDYGSAALLDCVKRSSSGVCRIGTNFASVRILSDAAGISIEDSKVFTADIQASNGVIHAIDKILVPQGLVIPVKNLASEIASQSRFKTLNSLLKKTGLDAALTDGPGQRYTVFAPTDEAFGRIPAAILQQLASNPDQLKRVLLKHVSRTVRLDFDDLTGRPRDLDLTALSGDTLDISTFGRRLGASVNDAFSVESIETTNGTIFVIDRVL
jgi:transforming growth factor-beta-induced protein